MAAFTIALWAWIEPTGVGPDRYMIQTASGNLAYNASDHSFFLFCFSDRNGAAGAAHAGYWWRFTNNVESTWTHLCFVVFADNTARFYTNGSEVPIGPRNYDEGVVSDYNYFNVGALQADSSFGKRYYGFNGKLDEVRIYDGALNPTEVLQLLAPSIGSQPVNRTVAPGSDVNLSVAACGMQPLNYQWFFNGGPILGASQAILTVTNAGYESAGVYSLTVSNAIDSVTSAGAILSFLGINRDAGLTIAGPLGTNYVVEFTPSLDPTNSWQTLTNLVLPASPYLLIDPESAFVPQRFYRARPQP
jgi:hypothetical protein